MKQSSDFAIFITLTESKAHMEYRWSKRVYIFKILFFILHAMVCIRKLHSQMFSLKKAALLQSPGK